MKLILLRSTHSPCHRVILAMNGVLNELERNQSSSLKSLIATGTKLWLDSIDPDLIKKNRARSHRAQSAYPIIISDLIKTGRFDNHP